MSRYESKAKGVNRGKFYEEFLQERNIKRLTQYRTPKFPVLNTKVRSRFSTVFHSWKLGDSYWKLAGQYYGDEKLWWAIAWYNEKPTESHLSPGDTVLIPNPIEEVVSYFHFGA
jgi:nucleoid-associated protein YgaU